MRPHNLNGGRPKFVPTKEQQSDVRALASCGNSQAVIANYLHISINTLKLHFAEELSAAAIKANQAVAINLFRIATRGSGAAAGTIRPGSPALGSVDRTAVGAGGTAPPGSAWDDVTGGPPPPGGGPPGASGGGMCGLSLSSL